MKIDKKTIVSFPKDHPVLWWLILAFIEFLLAEILSRFFIIPHAFYLFFANTSVEKLDSFAAIEQASLININIGVRIVVLAILLFITAFAVWYSSRKKQKEDSNARLKGLEQQVVELEKQLTEEKQRSQLLESEEKPFKEIRDMVAVLCDYTNQSEVVDSIQLFECTSLPDPDKISPNGVIEVAFKFKDGTAASKANVNVLYNICYQVPSDICKPFMELINKRQKYFSERKRVRNPKTEGDIQKAAIALFNEVSSILNDIESVSDITDQHYALYRILQILVNIVIAKKTRVSCQQLLHYKEGVEYQLKVGLRTGMLGALLLQTMYCFANENSVYKQGRSYFAAPLEYKENKLIMLVVLQRNKLRIDSDDDELDYCTEVYDEIESWLKSNLKRRSQTCPTH